VDAGLQRKPCAPARRGAASSLKETFPRIFDANL
jgi:hypothetical protein